CGVDLDFVAGKTSDVEDQAARRRVDSELGGADALHFGMIDRLAELLRRKRQLTVSDVHRHSGGTIEPCRSIFDRPAEAKRDDQILRFPLDRKIGAASSGLAGRPPGAAPGPPAGPADF